MFLQTGRIPSLRVFLSTDMYA